MSDDMEDRNGADERFEGHQSSDFGLAKVIESKTEHDEPKRAV